MEYLDPWYLLVALISGCIGLGAFLYGKRMQDGKFLFGGIVIMVSGYLVTDPLGLAALTTALTGLLFERQIRNWWNPPPKKKIHSVRGP